MAQFRRLARELARLNNEVADGEQQPRNRVEDGQPEINNNERRDVGRDNAIVAVGRAEPAVMRVQRSGTREVNFLTLDERNNMFSNRNGNNALGLVPRGTSRRIILGDHRSVRVRFTINMTSLDVHRAMQEAMLPYEYVRGQRIQRPTNNEIRRLLRSPNIRVVFYRSGASGHQVLRLQFNGTFPTGEEILRAYHRANARIYIYIYEEFLQNNHESDESDDEEDRDDDIVFLPNVQSTPQQERGNRDLLPNGQSTPQQDRGNRQVPNSNADREELRGTDMEGGEERAVENLHDGREESQEQQHENMENNSDDMEVDRELQEAPTVLLENSENEENDEEEGGDGDHGDFDGEKLEVCHNVQIEEDDIDSWETAGTVTAVRVYNPSEIGGFDDRLDDIFTLSSSAAGLIRLPAMYSLSFQSVIRQARASQRMLCIAIFTRETVTELQRILTNTEFGDSCIIWPVSLNATEIDEGINEVISY